MLKKAYLIVITMLCIAISAQAQTIQQLSKVDKKRATEKAAQEYEAIMLGTILKSVDNNIDWGGIIKKDETHKIYQDMLTDQYARKIAEQGGVGISKSVIRAMKKVDTTLAAEIDQQEEENEQSE